MSEEKPLHVRVAEALGRKPCPKWKVWGQGLAGTEWIHEGKCEPPCYPPTDPPRYDTNWSLTGPLIEKYRLWVHPCNHDGTEHWTASSELALDEWDSPEGGGTTPLLAICNLILALAEAGKLK